MVRRSFEFYQDDTLPDLAWLAKLEAGKAGIEVIHGAGVDIGDDCFFEGAWAGEFPDWAFHRKTAFGTGARIDDDGVAFFPPDHTLDQIFLCQKDDSVVVSNSLAFLLAATDDRLPTDRCDYFTVYERMIGGLANYRGQIPLRDGSFVTSWFCKTLRIDANLAVSATDKELDDHFETFAEYNSLMTETMRAVFANAAAPGRTRTYMPMSSISSGYDSTAISTLAADLGCSEAFTFAHTRPSLARAAENDSGAEAARLLGLHVHEIDRLSYTGWNEMIEIEGYGVGSEIFSARDRLRGRIFLSGYMGDTMWDREPAVVSDSLCWPLPAGHNLGEFRLATNMVHFPVPFIGARHQPGIVGISQSAEMAPWRLNTTYDRPICRRIAEEKGIPREAFGVRKRAAAVFFRDEGLRATMTAGAYRDYAAFRASESRIPGVLARTLDKGADVARLINAVFRRLRKLAAARLSLTIPLIKVPDNPGIWSESALLFPWAVDRLTERYRPAIAAHASAKK